MHIIEPLPNRNIMCKGACDLWSGYQNVTFSVTQSMFLFTFEISVCERTISVGMTIFGLQKRLCTLIDAHGSGQQCFEVSLFYRAIILNTQHNSSGTYHIV